MEVGKLKNSELKKLVIDNIGKRRKEVIKGPKVGEDCARLELGDKLIYLSSDPITGTAKEIGKLAVNITCNDLATQGVEPIALMVTLLFPPKITKEEIEIVVKDFESECGKLNVEIAGGHTEITSAVNQVVASVTGIAYGEKKEEQELEEGDIVVLTKGVGIEGTGIIAYEKEKELVKELGKEFVEEAKKYLDKISVVEEGLLAKDYAKVMHDVTEGGVLGAIWELSENSKLGVEIEEDKLNISETTRKICEIYRLDPLKLISSGSMLMIVAKDKLEKLKITFKENKKIEIFPIGKLTKNENKILLKKDNQKILINEPISDELYKIY